MAFQYELTCLKGTRFACLPIQKVMFHSQQVLRLVGFNHIINGAQGLLFIALTKRRAGPAGSRCRGLMTDTAWANHSWSQPPIRFGQMENRREPVMTAAIAGITTSSHLPNLSTLSPAPVADPHLFFPLRVLCLSLSSVHLSLSTKCPDFASAPITTTGFKHRRRQVP